MWGGDFINKRNFIIYGSYLTVLVILAMAVTVFGLDKKIALWATVIMGATLMALWPRW
ncbi:MAG: hypothetical protein M0Z31_08955 [Clostridia bacterium]|nr:hypothetical protein [Clostridia bacterium]